MLEIFWDLYQQRRINETAFDADTAKSRANEALSQSERVSMAIDRLTLINRALWELMRDRFDLDEKTLLDKINQIDLRDGKLDGKISMTTHACPGCNRVLNPRHKKCIYCGTPNAQHNPFDGVR